MESILKSERGATLVYVALSSFVLLMFLGLATDTGWMVWVKTQGQKRVDSAALAAARALVDQNAGNRSSKATTLANTFSDQNLVVDSSTDPANTVTPISYNLTTGALTELALTDWDPGTDGAHCNAVRVTTTVPTPLFFAGVRGFVTGTAEASSKDITVGAVAHLPCPGSLTTAGAPLAPIALRQCKFSTGDCESGKRLLQFNPTGADNAAWTTFNVTPVNTPNCVAFADGPPYPPGLTPTVKVGDTIQIDNGDKVPCLNALETYYSSCTPASCVDPPDSRCVAVVPIIECVGSSAPSKVTGFTTICFTAFNSHANPKYVDGTLECSEEPTGVGGAGGACLGTYSRAPILVQ